MVDIDVSDLVMNDICNSPIYIRLGDRMRAPEGFPFSTVRDIRIRNVSVKDADCRYACLIAGVEGHPVRDVRIENVDIQFRGGLTMADYEEQRGVNPFFVPSARKPSERGEANYPEPSAHGIQPAWGFSIMHAENIRLKNVRLELLRADERPWIYKRDARRVKMRGTLPPPSL